eukprot:813899-Prymnesium_polylepis.2
MRSRRRRHHRDVCGSRNMRRSGRHTGAACAEDGLDPLAAEHLIGQCAYSGQRCGHITLAVTKRKNQLRLRQQLVGHAVTLVVDLAQRLVPACSRPPAAVSIISSSVAKHGQQHTQPHHRHPRLWRPAVVRRRVCQSHARPRRPPLRPAA